MYRNNPRNRIPHGGKAMKAERGKTFVKSIVSMLIPGILTGIILTVLLTVHEYDTTARMTGAVLREKSVVAGMKNQRETDRKAGEEFLSEYGYHKYRNFAENFAVTMVACILCFEGAGVLMFWRRRKEMKNLEIRIDDLTQYLRAVNRGEAKALARREDQFSHLEDEIYKVMMELTCTKEAAVRDHAVLSDRIADIAHQLKTPLTSMSLMAELLEEYQPEEAKEYLGRLKNQVERLKNLASGLLILAKLDSHTLLFKKERLEISAMVREAAEPLCGMMEEKDIHLEIKEPKGNSAEVEADRQWTGEAVLNILKNCAEHTPKGGEITVSYEDNPIYSEIRIEDGGKGFEKKDIPHLFERFYRGEGAAKDSAGIGLALAKSIIESQNGQILAENTSEGNARFRIRFKTSTKKS